MSNIRNLQLLSQSNPVMAINEEEKELMKIENK